MKSSIPYLSLVFVLALLLLEPAQAASGTLTAAIRDGETIAFLGDSITAGGEGHGGYCRLVMHGLRTKGIRVNGIFAGVPGEKSPDMLLRLDSILQQEPDHLFLLAGVNDVWMTDPTARIGVFKPSPGMGTSLEHYKIYIPAILDRCKAAGVKVILATCTPIMEDPEFRLNKKAKAYNAFLRLQAKERNLPIALLNEAFFKRIGESRAQAPAGKRRNVLTSDGVHPVGSGYRVMALGILKAMGFTEEELAALEEEWKHGPQIQVIGCRQVRSSTRYTGWMTMVLDVMNSDRAMVTSTHLATKNDNTATMVKRFLASPRSDRIKHLLFVPLMADIHKQTPPAEYKASLQALVEEARKRKLRVALSTYAMVGPDPAGKINAAARPYNTLIREVAEKNSVALSDIATAMQAHFARHPKACLNLADERFNYPGSLLMVETVCKALDVDTSNMAALCNTWSKARCYTFRYSDSTWFKLQLSAEGRQALEAVSGRYHKLGAAKILDYGIYLLLNDTSEANKRRLEQSRSWASPGDETAGLSFRKYPRSSVEKKTFETYLLKEKIDYPTFFTRAFRVGLCALRREDVLGRGAF